MVQDLVMMVVRWRSRPVLCQLSGASSGPVLGSMLCLGTPDAPFPPLFIPKLLFLPPDTWVSLGGGSGLKVQVGWG